MKLADLLAAMNDEDGEENLTDRQKVDAMSEALSSENHEFRCGDVLLHKRPIMADTQNGGQPAMFVSAVNPPIFGRDHIQSPGDVYSLAAAKTADCIILKFVAGRLCRFYADSRDYRPHPDFPHPDAI